MSQALHALVLLGFSGLLFAAAYGDLRRFQIPNAISIALALLYPFAAIANGAQAELAPHLIFALFTFLIGAGFFAAGLFGGGDVKLFAAVAFWVGPHEAGRLLVYTAGIGGILALVLLTRQGAALVGRVHATSPAAEVVPDVAPMRRPVPYGVAIAIAGLAIQFSTVLL